MHRIRILAHRYGPRAAAGTVVGLVAAGLAVGVGELVAVFTGPETAPVFAVGSAAIDLTPTPLREFAVRNFGTNDKPILLAGIYATLGVVAVVAGVLALRRVWLGVAVVAGFGALGAWAALSRPVAALSAMWPSLVGAVVGSGFLYFLVAVYQRRNLAVDADASTDAGAEARPDGSQDPEIPRRGRDRRTFLALTAGGAVAATVAGFGGDALIARRYNVAGARSRVRIPVPAVRAPALPPGAHPNVAGLSEFFTPNAGFYRVDTALVLPQIDPNAWTLRIRGMVDHPLEVSFADLLARPLVEHDQTLSCVSNEVGGQYVGTARWIGAPLADLLRAAGVQRGADQLVGRSVDGMTIGTPVESVLDGRQALLAVAMNGEALPIAHGFPCRMLVPGFFGYVSATKWLVDLELTTFADYDPYWVRRGWAKTAPVKTASRIDVPKPFAHVPAGTVTVAGVAWATHRGVEAVEVRVDGGPWAPARLATSDGPDAWRQWTCDLELAPGPRRLEVRATDAAGAVQPEQRADPFPDGSTGWHSVVVTANRGGA